MAGNVIDFQRTCIIIVVFAIFLVTIHHSTNGMFSSHGPQYDFASFAKFSTPAPIANKPPTKEHVPVCRNSSDDPYLLPGYLLTNENDTASPSWEPFDVAFPPPPQFLKNLMDHKSFPWLHGKTLLLIGDSVDRNNAAYLCDFLNGTTRVTSLTNLNEDFPASERTAGSHPTVCRLEAHDFEIITFFHYGMHDQGEEIWTYKSSYTPPGLFQTRIPLLETLFATYHRQPNLITLTSGISLIDRQLM
jgi:hypothetical protein